MEHVVESADGNVKIINKNTKCVVYVIKLILSKCICHLSPKKWVLMQA